MEIFTISNVNVTGLDLQFEQIELLEV